MALAEGIDGVMGKYPTKETPIRITIESPSGSKVVECFHAVLIALTKEPKRVRISDRDQITIDSPEYHIVSNNDSIASGLCLLAVDQLPEHPRVKPNIDRLRKVGYEMIAFDEPTDGDDCI